jgi:tetrapyrrole methylase family protein / MazG family protein
MTTIPDTRGRVVVVGLGPAGVDLVTEQTRAAIARIPVRFLRTARHPAASAVPDASTFDHVYETTNTFDEVYERIADDLVAAADRHGEILYAVPGSPLVLERTVTHLRSDPRIQCEILPAMSFLDVAYARLGIDPVEAGLTLVDGHVFATAAAGMTGPLLIAHCHANWVLSDIKLALDDADDTPVVILQRLGLPDESIVHTVWSELDRAVDADHLTSVYIPRLTAPVGAELVRFHELARTLRDQCPWDREQTHQSLVPYLVEETFEVVDAIAALDDDDHRTDDALVEELGDLLYQIEFHAAIAEQQGRFTMADVARGIHDKLVRRHPHVFAPDDDTSEGDLVASWESIKRAEKEAAGRTGGPFESVPTSLPALAYATAILKKAARAGLADPDTTSAGDDGDESRRLGRALLALVIEARSAGIDAETALRAVVVEHRAALEDPH